MPLGWPLRYRNDGAESPPRSPPKPLRGSDILGDGIPVKRYSQDKVRLFTRKLNSLGVQGSTKIYEQAGFVLSRSEDHQIVAKLNTEKLPRISSPSDPRYQRSKKLDGKLSTSRMLEEEIERLSYLLQEEQESHRRTKMERADELRKRIKLDIL